MNNSKEGDDWIAWRRRTITLFQLFLVLWDCTQFFFWPFPLDSIVPLSDSHTTTKRNQRPWPRYPFWAIKPTFLVSKISYPQHRVGSRVHSLQKLLTLLTMFFRSTYFIMSIFKLLKFHFYLNMSRLNIWGQNSYVLGKCAYFSIVKYCLKIWYHDWYIVCIIGNLNMFGFKIDELGFTFFKNKFC